MQEKNAENNDESKTGNSGDTGEKVYEADYKDVDNNK